MSEVTMYKCDKCGRCFKKEENSKRCEDSHIATVSLTGEVKFRYMGHQNYPTNIEIEMADGTKQWYKFDTEMIVKKSE